MQTKSDFTNYTKHIKSVATEQNLHYGKSEIAYTQIYYSSKPTEKKLPLKITQDSNRLTINLAKTDSLNEHDSSSEACDKLVEEAPALRQSRFKRFKSVLNARQTKPPKNENIIRIIKENCEKQKVQPCDAFILPLMALSNFYSADKTNESTSKFFLY